MVVIYWNKAESEKTDRTLEIAVDEMRKRKIKNVVIASNTGATVEKFLEKVEEDDFNVVGVTHHAGFKEPGECEMSKSTREELKEKGVKVLTTTHALSGVARSIKNKYGGLYPAEIIANALRMIGSGVKVSVEISIMALDAGLIPHGEEIVGIGGSGNGADTACIIRPEHSHKVFETKVLEILCKPRE